MQVFKHSNHHTFRNVSLQAIPDGYIVWDARTFECVGTVLRYAKRRWSAVAADVNGVSRWFVAKSLSQAIERISTNNF